MIRNKMSDDRTILRSRAKPSETQTARNEPAQFVLSGDPDHRVEFTAGAAPLRVWDLSAVQAKSQDAASAVAAADQAADRLVTAAAEARGGTADDTATRSYEQGQAAVRQAQAQVSAATSTSGRARAADALALAQVRLEGLAQAVRASTIAAQSGSSGVTVTQRAAVVSSSTPRALLLGGFAGGVLVALVVGAVVVWRGSARR